MAIKKREKEKQATVRRHRIIIAAVFIIMTLFVVLSFFLYANSVYRTIKEPDAILNELKLFNDYNESVMDKEQRTLSMQSHYSFHIFLVDKQGDIVDTGSVQEYPVGQSLYEIVSSYDFKKADELRNAITGNGKTGELSCKDGDRILYFYFSMINLSSGEFYLFSSTDDVQHTELANSIVLGAIFLFVFITALFLGIAIFFIIWFNKRNVQLLEFNEKLHYMKEQYYIALSHTKQLLIFDFDMLTRTLSFQSNSDKVFKIAETIYNVPDDNVLSKLVHKDDITKYRTLFKETIEGAKYSEIEIRIRNNGNYVWNKVSMQIVNNLDGHPVKAIGFIEDISNYVNAKAQAENEAIVKKTLFNMYKHGFEVNITRDKFISGEQEICDVVEIAPPVSFSELVDHITKNKLNEEDAATIRNMYKAPYIQHCYDNKRNVIFECKWASRTRGLIWLAIMVSFFKNSEGDYLALFLVSDIDEVKKESLTLMDKAKYDSATSLFNKASTEDQVKNIIANSRGTNRIHAMIMIDLDNLKTINDNAGHFVGDRCIYDLADIIRKMVRSTDVAGRVGGDEFLIFLNDIRDKDSVAVRVQELLSQYSSLSENYNDITPSFSAGISFFKNGMTYDELYKTADTALYRSKKKGGKTYTIYSETKDNIQGDRE